jgi:hypothetical protein
MMVRQGAKVSGVRSDVQECERLHVIALRLDSAAMERSLFTVVNDDRHTGEHGDISGLVDGTDEQLV